MHTLRIRTGIERETHDGAYRYRAIVRATLAGGADRVFTEDRWHASEEAALARATDIARTVRAELAGASIPFADAPRRPRIS